MKLLFVMDPFEALDLDGDTTLAFLDEAARRGHETWACTSARLSLEHDRAVARARRAVVRLDRREARAEGEARAIGLHECDAVFLREDPPFDPDYLLATLLCEAARGRTFVNDPRGLREANEKLFALRFPEMTPPTIVTADMARIRAFVAEQGGAVVVKPLEGKGGEGVFVLREGDLNANAIVEAATAFGRRHALAQRYLPEARAGDKRILLLDGEPIGAVLRVPRPDDLRANLHVGGRPERTSLTARDRAICARLAPALVEWGLTFAGIDVIGEWLIEINVTSPTGLRQIDALEGGRLAARVIDRIEARAPGRSRS